jgi:hypothetical protein
MAITAAKIEERGWLTERGRKRASKATNVDANSVFEAVQAPKANQILQLRLSESHDSVCGSAVVKLCYSSSNYMLDGARAGLC